MNKQTDSAQLSIKLISILNKIANSKITKSEIEDHCGSFSDLGVSSLQLIMLAEKLGKEFDVSFGRDIDDLKSLSNFYSLTERLNQILGAQI